MGLLSLNLRWPRNNPAPDKGPQFYVDLDEPHRTYAPGAQVTGSVVLKLAKPQRANAVIAKFQGFVYIKNPLLNGRGVTKKMFNMEIPLWLGDADPAASPSAAVSTGPDGLSADPGNSSVAGRSEASTAADSLDVTATATSTTTASQDPERSKKKRYKKEGTLPAGEHQFPFEFHLPSTGLMSSLTFERGSISYLVSGILRRPGRLPQQSPERSLSVTCPLDVSALPPAKLVSLAVDVGRRRARATSSKSQKKDSRVLVQVELPTKGYIRGEEIPIRMVVHHQWLVHSSAAIVLTLVRLTRLFGDQIDAQTFRKDLDQTVLPLYTDPKTLTAIINGSLRVPADAFPSMRHRDMVSFQYMIEVALDITGKRDLQKYVSTGPSYSMIDTVDLKHKSGMVSAWTEVVIGTCRSTPAGLNGPRPDGVMLASERSIYVDLSSSSSMRSRPSSSPLTSPRNSPPGVHGTAIATPSAHSTSSSSATPNTPPHDEKSVLAAHEQARMTALLPSMPEYPTSSPDVSAPPVAGGSITPPLATAPDKRELERQQLQAQASAPDDFVPRYEARDSGDRTYTNGSHAQTQVPPQVAYAPSQVPSRVPSQSDVHYSDALSQYSDEVPAPYYSVASAPPVASGPVPSAPPEGLSAPPAPGPSAPPASLDYPVSAPPFASVPAAGRRELPLSAPPG